MQAEREQPQEAAEPAHDMQSGQAAPQEGDSRRPDGVSKIDLRDVWGGRTPATSPEATAGKFAHRRSSVCFAWLVVLLLFRERLNATE